MLARKLQLTGVALDQPQITLTKQPTEPLQPVPAATESASTSTSGTTTSASSGGGGMFQFVLSRAKISGGSFTMADATGATTADLQGINASADTSGYADGRDVTGSLKIAKVTASNMQVTDFSAPFTYHANYLAAKQFDATAYGGSLAGDFLMDASAGPSTLTLNGNGLNVEQLAAATSSNSSAHLTGSLDFQSKWRGIETGAVNGEGDAQLANGKLQGVRMLDEVGSALKIDELKEPVISKAVTHFIAHDRQVDFNGLQVTSTLFSITGHGTTGFDGSLDADLVLILTRDAMGKLPKELANAFVQQSDGTGTIGLQGHRHDFKSSTDLSQKLIMQGVQKQLKNQFNKALNKFFH